MMTIKKWYAVQMDSEDNDWGTGTYDWDEAVAMARRMGNESVIAEIEEGSDPVCVAEYYNGEDF